MWSASSLLPVSFSRSGMRVYLESTHTRSFSSAVTAPPLRTGAHGPHGPRGPARGPERSATVLNSARASACVSSKNSRLASTLLPRGGAQASHGARPPFRTRLPRQCGIRRNSTEPTSRSALRSNGPPGCVSTRNVAPIFTMPGIAPFAMQ